MHQVIAEDDLFHRTPANPKISLVWKENAYLNAYDDERGFACI
jgi:hypothetical protein